MDKRLAFGSRVRAIRDARGYSQEKLAEMAALHRTYVGAIERGERNVSLLNIWRIANALKIDPSILFTASSDSTIPSARRARGNKDASVATKQDSEWTKKRKR